MDASPRARIDAASSAALTAPARPMASVPTGTPAGIWAIESSESTPWRAWLSTGTPSTGRWVLAASIPGRWAAPPAPAMITLTPLASAEAAYSNRRSGVRWAETTLVSWITPSCSSVSEAWRRVSQSEEEPITTPTRAVEVCRSLKSRSWSRSPPQVSWARRRGGA